jgi:hypothetical protein
MSNVLRKMTATLNLPKKWAELRPEDIGNLELELARETSPGHPLHGCRVKALYRRYPHDDVLFEIFEADYPYYHVHLTWSVETNSNWPYITRFASLADFCANYEMTREVTDEDPRWQNEKWRFYEDNAA